MTHPGQSAASQRPPLLEASGVRKHYIAGDGSRVDVLDGVDLTVARGEFVAIIGASGAGKSTLLHLLGALDLPSEGVIRLEGRPYDALGSEELAAMRNRRVGFVFQFHHLLREFSALENVMMPLRIGGTPDAEAQARAAAILKAVGLGARLTHRPAELSGGEQQRVATARALATDPAVVLADEPSGNLDQTNGERLHDLLVDVVRMGQRSLVVVTHNLSLAGRADRILLLDGGRLSPWTGAAAPAEAVT